MRHENGNGNGNGNGIQEQHLLPYEERLPQKADLRFKLLPAPEGPPSEQYASIGVYWHILLRRRWVVLTVAAIVTTLAALAAFKTKPVYQATARMQIDADVPQRQSIEDPYQQAQTDQDSLRTEIQVLQSDNLAWRTIQKTGLSGAQDLVLQDGAEPDKVRLIGDFRSHLSVQLIPGTRVIQIAYENTDPNQAAQVVNALADNYIEYNFREKYDATRQASGRMEQQLDELKAKVEKSQQDLVEYQKQHSIVDINAKESVVEQRLGELSTQLTTAQADRIQKEALDNQIRSNPGKIASLTDSNLLQQLEEKRADIKQQYVEALAQYGPSFPKVQRLKKQFDEAQLPIDQQLQLAGDRIHSEYLAAQSRENLLQGAVAAQKVDLGEYNKQLVEQNILKGEFDTNQQLYQRLLQHLKDAVVSAGLKSSNVHLVDVALPPVDPIRPRKFRNITMGLMVGLVLGISVAFILESLDQSVKSSEELEVLVAMPTLAVIPAKQTLPRRTLSNGNGNGHGRSLIAGKNGKLELAVLNQPTSVLAESFRSLRTSTLLSTAVQPPQILLMTSAGVGEGKTTTSINLALSLAQQQGDILLIDCDLRKRSVARALGLDNRKGLSTLLTGRTNLEQTLQRFAPLPRLWAITAGPLPPNPAELLSSDSMADLLKDLRKRFRHIIVDSPPLLMVTDGAVLSTLADGVILVVESGITPRKSVVRASKILQSVEARKLGVALNKVDVRFDGYYGYYHYGYYAESRKA